MLDDYRSTFVAAGLFMGALLVGCGDPDLPTDLRTSGPPNVTAVTVMSDLETSIDPDGPLGRFIEDATFCRLDDNKRPSLVSLDAISSTLQVCPVDLSMKAMKDGAAEAAPPAWFFRIVFDKLLDPSIEDLDTGGAGGTFGTLKNTQPVTLRCNDVDIAYDGYYVPNGNKESWPLGPNLTIQPISPTDAPTGATCTVTIKDNVHSKSGQPVPMDQRTFTFKLAPMSLREQPNGKPLSNPTTDEAGDGTFALDRRTPIDLFFTAEIKVAGTHGALSLSDLDPSKVVLTSGQNKDAVTPNAAVCDGSGGTPIDPALIRVYVRGTKPEDATKAALVLRVDAGGALDPAKPDPADPVWEPNTTYRLTFLDGAAVTPRQGGAAGALPGDFSLCFHTQPLSSP
jgi:hypothetical protein